MMLTDPVADMLSRIRNAVLAGKSVVIIPNSKLKLNIATILKETGFIDEVKVDEESKFNDLLVTINDPDSNPRITSVERVSKPGRRKYVKAADVPQVMNGRGIYIISTSKGVMTDAEARQEKVGGELMVKVY